MNLPDEKGIPCNINEFITFELLILLKAIENTVKAFYGKFSVSH